MEILGAILLTIGITGFVLITTWFIFSTLGALAGFLIISILLICIGGGILSQ